MDVTIEYDVKLLEGINQAIFQGTKRVEYRDKVLEYRSLDEMLRIRRIIMQGLGLLNGTPSRVYGSFSKGVSR